MNFILDTAHGKAEVWYDDNYYTSTKNDWYSESATGAKYVIFYAHTYETGETITIKDGSAQIYSMVMDEVCI